MVQKYHQTHRVKLVDTFIAFTYGVYPLWVLVRWILLVAKLNSTLAANLARIDRRISWVDGDFKPLHSGIHWTGKVIILLVVDLLMWIVAPATMLFEVCYRIHLYYKRQGIPQQYKELNWKLSNLHLTSEQITEEFSRLV